MKVQVNWDAWAWFESLGDGSERQMRAVLAEKVIRTSD